MYKYSTVCINQLVDAMLGYGKWRNGVEALASCTFFFWWIFDLSWGMIKGVYDILPSSFLQLSAAFLECLRGGERRLKGRYHAMQSV